MSFDFESFLIDNQIEYWTTGKNVTAGWINVQCPFCGDHSNHGGFDPVKNYYNCWNCGWHSLLHLIMELLSVEFYEANQLLEKYSHTARTHLQKEKNDKPTSISLPEGTGELTAKQKNYLSTRNFDPDYLQSEFNLKGTGNIGLYKFRIIAPIYYQHQLVSYQGRDITGQQIKYKACQKKDEIIHHKDILYNIDNAKNESIVVVEGITDVWRLGADAVCTFGIGFKNSQLNLLSSYKRIFIFFDSEEQAQNRAEKLAYQLSLIGSETDLIELNDTGDPADLSQDEADYMMKSLIFS